MAKQQFDRKMLFVQLDSIIMKLHSLKEQKHRQDQKIDNLLSDAEACMKLLRLRKYQQGLCIIERRKPTTRTILDQKAAEELLQDVPPIKYRKKVKVPTSIVYREGKIELKDNLKSESLCRKFGGQHPTGEDDSL